jgi:arginine-tRNA-protein transferase
VTDQPGRQRRISLYRTGPHPCSYLPDLIARTQFVDPLAAITPAVYELLLEQGFRRSGSHIYRPDCDGCAACVPVRVPVTAFTPNRSQRRNAAMNADVALVERPARYQPEHYALYETYVRSRHAEGSMAEQASPASYYDFLLAPWGGETRLLELRLGPRLVAVAVTDRQPGSLSAVYTFFDPAFSARAPGTLALLRQIELARTLGLDHLYLGYWIQECPKMSYKDAYRPVGARLGGRWRPFARGVAIPWQAAEA